MPSDTTDNTKKNQAKPASLGLYLATLLYDCLLVMAVLFVASIIYIIPIALNTDIDSSQTRNLSTTAFQSPVYKTWIFIIWFAFFAWFWTKAGQTLGLRVWKLRIESIDGNLMSLWQALLRFFSAQAPWFFALFLYHLAGKTELIDAPYKYWILLLGFSSVAWSLVDKEGLSLHDRFSETRIVLMKKGT
ncbi:MAG: RDD family protein [Pseudomonadota bacterium]